MIRESLSHKHIFRVTTQWKHQEDAAQCGVEGPKPTEQFLFFFFVLLCVCSGAEGRGDEIIRQPDGILISRK